MSNATTQSPAPSSPSTTVTTPEQSPGADEDIWDTSSDHHDIPDVGVAGDREQGLSGSGGRSILSDVPSVRRQHMTDGYREGLSVGKASVMQAGFDAGYPFGVEAGLRVGTVLGVLEGVIAGVRKNITTTTVTANGGGDAVADVAFAKDGAFLKDLYDRASRELSISELMKGMDDEKIDRMGQPHSQGQETGAQGLPREIEEVLVRWEEVVLGCVGSKTNRYEQSTY
ncbi:Essential protein Yae1, N terminal [Exophiala sideris]|uniref:Protein YAE1 n=1 Tax=Exophiala sideris TaxID=1016849 RepID=A0ABR0JJY3_9EURO|nr:Essential protein Yae1, N terminal [Exophiala sideris]KAK5066294.1 Essential protein Yae1, N terminal [Exophiala sideris]KAK5186971.1 Essential protein Yae1, N terminal [Eurotiomycetes sp. CCFEE 6388]